MAESLWKTWEQLTLEDQAEIKDTKTRSWWTTRITKDGVKLYTKPLRW